uniref:Uncharacterized protein n=1 Tax=Timema poppense TaxID=170557 RepID=A0A7R9CIH4_TIMPO|nr:unnamed protein product [Timema poppensis]
MHSAIGSLVYCESSALDHVTTEAGTISSSECGAVAPPALIVSQSSDAAGNLVLPCLAIKRLITAGVKYLRRLGSVPGIIASSNPPLPLTFKHSPFFIPCEYTNLSGHPCDKVTTKYSKIVEACLSGFEASELPILQETQQREEISL